MRSCWFSTCPEWLGRRYAELHGDRGKVLEISVASDPEAPRGAVPRNGKPAAVLISHDDLESLEETLSILSDPAIMSQIHESEQALTKGEQATTLAELRSGLENRRNAAA